MDFISSAKYLKANKIGITFQGNYPVGSTKLQFKLADDSVNLYPYQRLKFELSNVTLLGSYNEDYKGNKFIYLDTPSTIAISGTTEAIFWFTSGQNDDNELMLKGDLIKNTVGNESLNYEAQYEEFGNGSNEFNTNFIKNGTPHFIDGPGQYKLNRLFSKVYYRKVVENTAFVSIGNVKVTQVDSKNYPSYYKGFFEFRISKTNTFARFLVDFDIYNNDVNDPKSHFLVTNLYQDIPSKIKLQFNFVTSKNDKNNIIKFIDVKLMGEDLGEVDIEFSVFNKTDMYIPAGYTSETINTINFLGINEIEFFEGILGYNTKHRFNLILPGDTYTLPKQIMNGTNLNDIQTSGYYYCWNNEDVSSIINYPTKENKKIFNLIVNNDNIGVYQELTVLNQTDLNSWRRYLLNGTWTEWYTFAKQKHTHEAKDDIIEDSEHRFVTDAQIATWNKAIEDLGNSTWLVPTNGLLSAASGKGNVVYNLADNHVYKHNGTKWLPIDIQNIGIDGNINTKLNDNLDNGYLVSLNILNKIALGNLSKGYQTLNGLAYIHSENNIPNYSITAGSIDLVKRTENYNISSDVILIGHNIINSAKSFLANSLMIGNNINAETGIIYGNGLKNNIGTNVVLLGYYNANINLGDAFVFGFGNSDTDRKTVLTIDTDGFLTFTGVKLHNYDNSYIVLAGGGVQAVSYFGKQEDIDNLYETKVDKGGTFLFELTAEDGSVGMYNILYDMDQQFIDTPNGRIIVDSTGKTQLQEGIFLFPEKGEDAAGQIFIPANVSTTGQDVYIDAVYDKDTDVIEPINISTLYKHTGFTNYATIINFDNYTITYSGGTPNPIKWYEP